MSQESSKTAAGAVPSADDLRMEVLEKQLAEIDRRQKAKEAEQKRLDEAAKEFLANHVSQKERDMIRTIVMSAVRDGKYEALVYSFPSSLCTDSGRAINNLDPKWPSTLQGKALELYEGFKANLQPKGYRMKALITDFPGGMPGNVGFILSWEPPRTY